MKKFTPPPLFNLMKGNTLKFTPVSSNVEAGPVGISTNLKTFTPSFEGMQGRYDKRLKEYKLSWWEPQSIFHHDSILMSAFYGMKWWDFREFFNIPRKDFLFVADSGGFQQLTTRERIEPVNVLRWEEKNADIGFILDIPPLDPKTLGPTKDFDFFKKCALQTARNADRMNKNRENVSGFKLYSVIQGSDKRELNYWSKQLEDFSFDGICGSPKPPNDPMQVALHIAYAHSKGVKNMHILLGTGKGTTPVNVFGGKFFNLFTFDSSAYATGSKFREYQLPYQNRSITFSTISDQKTGVKILPCDCPVCQLAVVDDLFAEGSTPGALISLHNLYNYIRQVNLLSSLSDDEEYYLQYVSECVSPVTAKAIRYLQDYRETQDFDSTYSKYFRKKKSLLETLS